MVNIPAMNEVRVQASGHEPKFPEESDNKRYMILYPDDYQGHGVDVEGNVALLLDEENAEEVKRLAEDILSQLENEE